MAVKFSDFSTGAADSTNTRIVGYVDGTTTNNQYTLAQLAPFTGLYAADGTLSGARSITFGANDLTFNASGGGRIIYSGAGEQTGYALISTSTGEASWNILSVAGGGTGATTFTANGILIGNTASAISATAELADGQLLIGRTGNAPVTATLTQGTDLSITPGNGSISIGHATVSNAPTSSSTTLSAGGNFTAINSVTVSAQGHLTAQTTETYTLPSDSDTTYAISALDGDNADEEKIVLTAGGSGSGSTTVVLEASTGLTVARSTNKITFTNSSPDQTVALTDGTGISTSGTYPNFTITNSAPDQTVALTDGTGISTSGTYPNFTITNSSPNQATPAASDGSPSTGQLQYNDGSNGFAAADTLVYSSKVLSVGKVGDSARSHLKIFGGDDGAGNDQDAYLTLYCSAGTHGVTIEGPDHTGGSNYTLKLPKVITTQSVYSSGGRILESDASGALQWIATPTDTSIYAANGVLTGDRVVTMVGNNLTFNSTGGLFTIQKNLKVEGQSYGDITSVSNATVDWDDGNIQSITLPSGASTYTPTNPQAGATYILKIIQPSAGDGTITWGSSVKWPGATAPTLTASNAAVDVVTLIYDGADYLATSVLNLS